MLMNGVLFAKDHGNFFLIKLDRFKSNKNGLGRLPMILSLHTGFRQYDYAPIESFSVEPGNFETFTLNFESRIGKEYRLTLTSNQQVFTVNKGFVNVATLSKNDIYIDVENNMCKLISSTKNPIFPDNIDFYQMSVKYNSNFFYNGILVR